LRGPHRLVSPCISVFTLSYATDSQVLRQIRLEVEDGGALVRSAVDSELELAGQLPPPFPGVQFALQLGYTAGSGQGCILAGRNEPVGRTVVIQHVAELVKQFVHLRPKFLSRVDDDELRPAVTL